MNKDSLGDRMKANYEDAYRIKLPKRMPILIRLDGVAWHSLTKRLNKPIDGNLVSVMNDTAKYLCENIQGVQLAYLQSDEISLLICNYKDINSQSWFDGNLQKMVSVAASMASAYFTANSWKIFRVSKIVTFDARAFVLPKEEVCNALLWRQQDATRNSIQMLARSLYSHKQCNNKSCSELQELIFKKGINWNDCPASQKRGRCIVKQTTEKEAINAITGEVTKVMRSAWVVDDNIPIFSQNRDYIDDHVFFFGEKPPLITKEKTPEATANQPTT